MAELIDIYTDAGEYIGVADRNVAHRFGLWHKTVHCWIVKDGKFLIFQKRSEKLLVDPGKLFSTASGHIRAGETIPDAFAREIFEETGLTVSDPIEIFNKPYLYDTVLKNGRPHHDYITWYLFAARCDQSLSEYKPQDDELDGFVELNINDLHRLAAGEIKSMCANALLRGTDDKFMITEIEVRESDFLLYAGETLANKFALWTHEVCEKLGC